jgi:hypothetical protein
VEGRFGDIGRRAKRHASEYSVRNISYLHLPGILRYGQEGGMRVVMRLSVGVVVRLYSVMSWSLSLSQSIKFWLRANFFF